MATTRAAAWRVGIIVIALAVVGAVVPVASAAWGKEAPATATATLEITPPAGLGPEATELAIRTDAARLSEMNAALQLALSDDLATRVLTEQRVPADVESEDSRRERLEARGRRVREALKSVKGDPVDWLRERLRVQRVSGSTLVSVGVTAEDRGLAADLANSVADALTVRRNAERRAEEARRLAGLQAMRMQLVPRVDDAVRSLMAFRRDAGYVEESVVTAALERWGAAKTEAELAVIDAEAALRAPGTAPAVEGDKELRELTAKLSELQASREAAVTTGGKSADHPEVKVLDQSIDQARTRINARRQLLEERAQREAGVSVERAKAKYQMVVERYNNARQAAQDMMANRMRHESLAGVYATLMEELKRIDRQIGDERTRAEMAGEAIRVIEPAAH